MRRAAWTVRVQLILAALGFVAIGFGIGWLARKQRNASPSSPSAAPTISAADRSRVPEVVKYVTTPTCGPRGMTRADAQLACREGWLSTDEARLLGVQAKLGEYSCTLSQDDDIELENAEDRNVGAMSSARIHGELCAPTAISADAIRLACKQNKISSDFARSLGIDAHPHGNFLGGHYGCDLAPVESQALERDEAAVVRSR